MNELKIFENEEFGQVRTTVINGEPWFVGTEIAKILGYSRPHNALERHVDEDDSLKQGVTDNLGRMQETILINESGLYSLVLSSKLPTAKKFKRWVTSEILPTIRKYGGYVTWDKLQDIMTNPHSLAEFLRRMLLVTEENDRLKKGLDEIVPKANYFDSLVDSNLLVNFRTTAKEMGIKPMRFTQFLLDEKYVYRDTKQIVQPMQPYVHCGFFEIKEFCRNGHCGTQTLITPMGRQHFLKLLSQCNVI